MSELGYLFLTLSSLHIIAPDLDVRDPGAMGGGGGGLAGFFPTNKN